ncbi:hypothetical protein BLNAU_9582 [Blattamonas nauphoetae]|uniref:Uncharacterized protein n=1 Tax=Blattamonas nauphoetae TaxID=2049346 RepID=A0ABQ9XVL7_9EUKA|nr:hypothetical protein BLNAU_9582 [Blattamonas nauphoetae]
MLRSLVASKCEAGEEVEWKDLMEWFVCTVIGLDSKASQSNGSFWFDWDDVVVDGFGTVRINLFASHSASSPPHSQQSFSDGIASLSLFFLDFSHRLSTSNCLPKQIEQHFQQNVISSIIHQLFDHLAITGHVVLTCDPSKFEEIVNDWINMFPNNSPNPFDLFDDPMWVTMILYGIIHAMEQGDLTNHIIRLTDTEFDLHSPQLTQFKELFEPALVEVRKRFDPYLFEEAKRISSWKELLQKVAGGEEVENDTSFLKLPFFRPTLLSLQAKFQQLASSLDGSEDSSTSSLLSSYSSHHTSLAAHLDSSLLALSSSGLTIINPPKYL